jgi:hypothetical protein
VINTRVEREREMMALCPSANRGLFHVHLHKPNDGCRPSEREGGERDAGWTLSLREIACVSTLNKQNLLVTSGGSARGHTSVNLFNCQFNGMESHSRDK